jgi:hypothetical protein
MGRVLKKAGWRRESLVLSRYTESQPNGQKIHFYFSKIFWGGAGPNDKGFSRKHILEGYDHSFDSFFLMTVALITR